MFSAFLALFLIPVCTILFAGSENWFSTNFSILGNVVDRQIYFIAWGILIGTYFFCCLKRISRLIPTSKRSIWLIAFDLLLLIFAVTTPYLPEQLPFQASLHFIFAFFSAVFLLLILLMLTLRLYQTDKRKFRPFLWELGGIILISVCLLLWAGFVTSALEIFFTISCSVFIFQLYRKVSAVSSSP